MIADIILAFGLVLSAQAAASPLPNAGGARTGGEPVAASASVSVRVVRPARIEFARESAKGEDEPAVQPRQRRVDDAGTIWIEFS